jgi:ribose 5-phosphate isomerase A
MSERLLGAMTCAPQLRQSVESAFLTDNGNYILDCDFGSMKDPVSLEKEIKQLPGIVEVGLFIGIADTLIVAFDDRVEVRERG